MPCVGGGGAGKRNMSPGSLEIEVDEANRKAGGGIRPRGPGSKHPRLKHPAATPGGIQDSSLGASPRADEEPRLVTNGLTPRGGLARGRPAHGLLQFRSKLCRVGIGVGAPGHRGCPPEALREGRGTFRPKQ